MWRVDVWLTYQTADGRLAIGEDHLPPDRGRISFLRTLGTIRYLRAKIDRESCRPSGAANKVPCIASWRCNVIRINIALQWTSTLRGMRCDV